MEIYTSHLSKVEFFNKPLTCLEVYTSHLFKAKSFNKTWTYMEFYHWYD